MSAHWSRIAERGSGFGFRFVFLCLRLLGRNATRIFLYPIVAYYFLVSRNARRNSKQYLQYLQAARLPRLDIGWATTFRHMYAFALVTLDKVAVWAGQLNTAKVSFPQRAAFDALCDSGRGALLVSAHLGNLEMARVLAVNEDKIINAVVYSDNAQRFQRILEDANADFSTNLIQVSKLGVDSAILLKEKIDKGEFLVIVGDRTPPAENGRTVDALFLGHPAPFAIGPWLLASLLECPVYLLICIPQGEGYTIHFELFAERIQLRRQSRQAELTACAQRYADRLGDYCAQAPLQWFNFFDFWHKKSDPL